MKKNKYIVFYTLIMALALLALGVISFIGSHRDSFNGIYSAAPLTDINRQWTDEQGKRVNLKPLEPDKNDSLTIYYRLPQKTVQPGKNNFFI